MASSWMTILVLVPLMSLALVGVLIGMTVKAIGKDPARSAELAAMLRRWFNR